MLRTLLVCTLVCPCSLGLGGGSNPGMLAGGSGAAVRHAQWQGHFYVEYGSQGCDLQSGTRGRLCRVCIASPARTQCGKWTCCK